MASGRTKKKGRKAKLGAEKRPPWRPTKLTPRLQETLCEFLARGYFFEHACAAVGVSSETVNNWIRLAATEDGSAEHRSFAAACAKARAEGEQIYLHGIRAKGDADWKADAWILSRLNPKRYAEAAKLEHTGAEGGPIQITGARDRLLARLARLAPPDGESEAGGEPDGRGGG